MLGGFWQFFSFVCVIQVYFPDQVYLEGFLLDILIPPACRPAARVPPAGAPWCPELSKRYKNNGLASKKTLVKWLFDIHNKTNLATGKSKITFDQFIKHYKYLYQKPSHSLNYYKRQNNNFKKFIAILVIVILILSSILIFQRFNIKFN